jgi:iron complex transport system substrate-binding protein
MHLPTKTRHISKSLAALASAAVISCLAVTHAYAEKTRYPLTLENCGHKITIQHAPDRTVSIGQSSTEILYVLGLGDKLAGTAGWLGPVLKDYEGVNAKIKRLADYEPSFESVLSTKPDLVTVQFEYFVGPEGVVAKNQQFEELGIPVYTSPSDCVGKDNAGGGDGVRHSVSDMGLIYQEIAELAQIYDVEDKGAEVIADLKARETAAQKKIAAANGKISAVFWFSSQQMETDPYVAGTNGAPGYILRTLGIDNVIKTEEEWPLVGWETIAKANPTIIVAGKMERRRYAADDIAIKLKFLKDDPVTSLMPAVKADHVIVMDAQSMNPTIRTIDGIETIADSVEKFGLTK